MPNKKGNFTESAKQKTAISLSDEHSTGTEEKRAREYSGNEQGFFRLSAYPSTLLKLLLTAVFSAALLFFLIAVCVCCVSSVPSLHALPPLCLPLHALLPCGCLFCLAIALCFVPSLHSLPPLHLPLYCVCAVCRAPSVPSLYSFPPLRLSIHAPLPCGCVLCIAFALCFVPSLHSVPPLRLPLHAPFPCGCVLCRFTPLPHCRLLRLRSKQEESETVGTTATWRHRVCRR